MILIHYYKGLLLCSLDLATPDDFSHPLKVSPDCIIKYVGTHNESGIQGAALYFFIKNIKKTYISTE